MIFLRHPFRAVFLGGVFWGASVGWGAPLAPVLSPGDNFEKHCIDCHGANGKSQTRLGRKSGAKDLSNAESMGKLSDAEIFKTIKFGRKNSKGEEKMEPFAGAMADAEINALVGWVRGLIK
ncbi:MAG: hypothetical protein RL077_2812 [Verrucomicrobiota bacterium]|jgi:mono/diheme cytochrome c family protein